MKDKIIKIVLLFGIVFLIINAIGYLLHIPSLVIVYNNPTGGGGVSKSNIPTILSVVITIIILVINNLKNKR